MIEWKASLQCCFLCGPGAFLCTLHYSTSCFKVFPLEMLTNDRLHFYFLVKLALVSNGDAFFVCM